MVWRAGLKDGAAKAQADENARVNLCSGHVSADTRSLFTPTRKPSRPEQSGRLHCDPRALGKGWSGVFQKVPHCPRFFLSKPGDVTTGCGEGSEDEVRLGGGEGDEQRAAA